MISTPVWWANYTRLVGYFHTHIDTQVDIWVQPIYQSNTGSDLRLWIMQISRSFSQSAMILRTLPPLYITFWSNEHNDMKDAIGVFKLKPFFQSAMTLRVFPPLYLPIFFNRQWSWEFFLLSTYHFESTNIIMWKMQLGCSSSNHFFSISNNPFWTHKHNWENNAETCFGGIQSFFFGSISHDWLFEDYCWLVLKLEGLNPPNTQFFTEIWSWFESAVRVGREMKVWILLIYNLPLRSEVWTTILTIFHWDLKSGQQWPISCNLQTPKLNFGSKKWILGAISTSSNTADCILLGRKVLNSSFFCSCFERGKTHNWKRQTQENAKQICSKWSSNQFRPTCWGWILKWVCISRLWSRILLGLNVHFTRL